jgi:CHASE3 domain sensor protein
MRKFFQDNWIIVFIGLALVISVVFSIRNNYIIQRNHELQQQTELVKQRTQEILMRTMHGLDLGVRGFGLTKDDKLLIPYQEAVTTTSVTFRQLDSLLNIQEYGHKDKLLEVKAEINNYMQFSKGMIDVARRDSMNDFTTMLKQDKGYDVWKKYIEFSQPLFKFEEDLNKQAMARYQAAIQSNLILQVSLLLLALPVLSFVMIKMRRERDARHRLLLEVEKNDREYVFNSGTEKNMTAEEINATSINNTHQASSFIKKMAAGDYEVEWDGLNKDNEALNNETLVGDLIHLREQLKLVKKEDEKRNWINKGLAEFSELVRNHQQNAADLAYHCISFLTKYLKAQQGSLFVLEGEKPNEYLNLAGCYAFDRKKYLEKKIDIGNSLVGQAFLEGDVIQLKEVPQGYTEIRSGLGDATPSYLIIVPLKTDVHIVAIAELAAFHDFEEHEIAFLKKAGEFLASAIMNSKNTHKMKQLLDDAAINEEQMKQREEEMRQNMEELMATQEELMRKEMEMKMRLTAAESLKEV